MPWLRPVDGLLLDGTERRDSTARRGAHVIRAAIFDRLLPIQHVAVACPGSKSPDPIFLRGFPPLQLHASRAKLYPTDSDSAPLAGEVCPFSGRVRRFVQCPDTESMKLFYPFLFSLFFTSLKHVPGSPGAGDGQAPESHPVVPRRGDACRAGEQSLHQVRAQKMECA